MVFNTGAIDKAFSGIQGLAGIFVISFWVWVFSKIFGGKG